jgi:hypothetical protein
VIFISASEIPQLPTLFYLFHEWAARSGVSPLLSSRTTRNFPFLKPGGRHCQVGSLAGAAHLLKDNAGVLRRAQRERKSRVEQKGTSSFDFDFQYEYKL